MRPRGKPWVLGPRWRAEDGVAIALVSLVGAVLILIAALVAYRGLTETGQVAGERRFEQALFVGEGAADRGLENLGDDTSWNTGHTASQLSDFAAVVAAADAVAPSQVIQMPEGEAVILKPSDDTTVYGVGYLPSRAASSRIVRVIEVEYQEVAGASWAPDAAVIGNGNVNIDEDVVTLTEPSSQHQGHIHANGNVDADDECTVDGDITASGSLDVGSCTVYGTTASGQPAVPFLDAAASAAWEAQLIAEAQAGGTTGAINLSGSQQLVINAPVYVNGDVRLRGDSMLTINGPGTVYVNGKVEVEDDATLTNGGLLAMKNKFETEEDASYLAVGDLTEIAVVSFSTSTNAIKLEGTAGGNTNGLAYAPNGGIQVEEDVVWRGALLAGGAGNKGRVDLEEDVQIIYPANLVSSSKVLAGTEVEIVSKAEL